MFKCDQNKNSKKRRETKKKVKQKAQPFYAHEFTFFFTPGHQLFDNDDDSRNCSQRRLEREHKNLSADDKIKASNVDERIEREQAEQGDEWAVKEEKEEIMLFWLSNERTWIEMML